MKKIAALLLMASCAISKPNLKIVKEYVWSEKINPDRSITVGVSGTRHINYHDKDAIKSYQDGAFEFSKQSAYAVCPNGYKINRALRIDYQSEDCSKKSYVNVRAINAGEEPLPSYCTFPVFDLNISCSEGDSATSSQQNLDSQSDFMGNAKPNIIQEKILAKLPQLQDCLSKEIERTELAYKGVAHLYFIIGPNGNVTKSEATSSDALPKPVLDCAANEIKKIKFPAPMGGGTVEVKQPLNFYPKNE